MVVTSSCSFIKVRFMRSLIEHMTAILPTASLQYDPWQPLRNQFAIPTFPVCLLFSTPLPLTLFSFWRGSEVRVKNLWRPPKSFFKSNNSLESIFYLESGCFTVRGTLQVACSRFCQEKYLLSS